MLIIFGSDNLFFLISLLVTLNHIHAAQKYKEGLCSDVLVDTCYYIGCSDFTVNNCPSSSFCQVACIANRECKSWTFDKVDQTCNLITCDLSIWTPNCDKIGAPADVDLNECLAKDSGCSSFKHGGCELDESYKIKEVYLNLDDCRYFCSVDPQCAYFISTLQICDIYSKKPFSDDDCKRTSGSTEPEIEQCSGGGKYLIVGGEVPDASDESTEVIELIKTDSTPSFGQLPSRRYGAVGAMFGNVPILCGGSLSFGDLYDSCLSFQNSKWSQSHAMNEKRGDAAGIQLNSTTFWILGGSIDRGINTDSTEFIIQGQTNGVPGPKLPYPLFQMCAVKLSESQIFVIGGSSGGAKAEVWIYNPQNGFARTQGPSMNTPRSDHSCSIMSDGNKKLIVVAGGGDAGTVFDSVLIYDPSDNAWHSGPSLPYDLRWTAMAESPDGRGVLIFGGISKNNPNPSQILELRAGSNSWNNLNINLEHGRHGHVVVPLQ